MIYLSFLCPSTISKKQYNQTHPRPILIHLETPPPNQNSATQTNHPFLSPKYQHKQLILTLLTKLLHNPHTITPKLPTNSPLPNLQFPYFINPSLTTHLSALQPSIQPLAFQKHTTFHSSTTAPKFLSNPTQFHLFPNSSIFMPFSSFYFPQSTLTPCPPCTSHTTSSTPKTSSTAGIQSRIPFLPLPPPTSHSIQAVRITHSNSTVQCDNAGSFDRAMTIHIPYAQDRIGLGRRGE